MDDEKTVSLSKVQVDYLYMLVSMVHGDDPDAPGIKDKLDVIRAEWEAEDPGSAS
jgi:hypothetical protein